jgi:hypothetical protein
MPLTRIKSLGITDGTIVNADINASAAIASTKLSGSFGITEADQWRVTTGFTLSGGSEIDITTNLERVDTAGQGILGTGMTESSGIFTFPSTGIWIVRYHLTASQNGENRYINAYINVTTNNSTYSRFAVASALMKQTSSSDGYSYRACETLIDVTSTANVKVKFSALSASSTPDVSAESDKNWTYFTFIRLGDT